MSFRIHVDLGNASSDEMDLWSDSSDFAVARSSEARCLNFGEMRANAEILLTLTLSFSTMFSLMVKSKSQNFFSRTSKLSQFDF